MTKKNSEAVITVRLSSELDYFIETYARKHGTSKNGVLVWLARKLYEQDQERRLDLRLKMCKIHDYEMQFKTLDRKRAQQREQRSMPQRQALGEGKTTC